MFILVELLNLFDCNSVAGWLSAADAESSAHSVLRAGCCRLRRSWVRCRVTRTQSDGSITVLASHYEDKELNSPNDLVLKSDDAIYFSDPTYGRLEFFGVARKPQLAFRGVYRVDPDGGGLTLLADDFVQPNGLAFSPDESLLYIVDTGATHQADGPHHVRRLHVGANAALTGGEVLATCPVGLYDGLRVDIHGNLWLSAGDGVHCHAPDGALLGKVRIPETVSNLCFGGPKRNRMFICGTTSLYSVYLNTRGR